jgi:hypothetical protein
LFAVIQKVEDGYIARFERHFKYPEPQGCRLVLQRKIQTITDHTSKDLAGWHVCLDVIDVLLNGKTITSREEQWKAVYPEYVRECQRLLQ